MKVGPDQIHASANQLEELMHDTIATLRNYQNDSLDLQAAGGLTGTAGNTNITTTAEVHDASMKVQTHWGSIIDALRGNTGKYQQTDHHNSTQLASIAGLL